MPDHESRSGKIELTIGDNSFVGEGNEAWLDQQINKFIDILDRAESPSSGDDLPVPFRAGTRTS